MSRTMMDASSEIREQLAKLRKKHPELDSILAQIDQWAEAAGDLISRWHEDDDKDREELISRHSE